jgi:hypothetical protein
MVGTATAAQNLRELAREQARQNPGVPLEQPSPPGDYWPKTIDELAREAEVILEARLSRVNSYLGSNEDRILTDYAISEATVIAGRLPVIATRTPGVAVPLIVTVYGGQANVDGVLVRAIDVNREAIKDDGRYLVFLRQSRSAGLGRYEIHYGCIFEIVGDQARPLLRRAEDVYKGTRNASLSDLRERVKRAVRER